MANRVAGAAIVAAAFLAMGCGGGGGGGTPSCSAFNAGACDQATYGTHSAQISSTHTLVTVDGVSCTFVMARTDMNPGACGDIYSCGTDTHTLAWAAHSSPPVYSWTIDNMFLTCSGGGGGGGGCAGKCSSCLNSCRGMSGCCCGSGCICDSDCTSSCGDNC